LRPLPKEEKRIGKSRPIPLRLSLENDAYVQRLQAARELNNRNLTINIHISEHKTLFEVYREKARAEILKLMRDYHIKAKELL